MMSAEQLRDHGDTLKAMARKGTSFKDVSDGWTLHVVHSTERPARSTPAGTLRTRKR